MNFVSIGKGRLMMLNILIGLLFVFSKSNLEFLDIGISYYLTNIIGYLLIFFGIRELGLEYEKVRKAQPYAVFMIFHSILFLLLNITGNSPLMMPLESYLVIIALTGLAFVIAGMFMIYVIISILLESLKVEFSTRKLRALCSAMMMTFILTGIFYFLIPDLAQVLMAILLFFNILFLFGFYLVFLRSKESVVEQ